MIMIVLYISSGNFLITSLWGNLHVESLACVDGWGQRVTGNSFYVQRVMPDFSWIFWHQMTQFLPVSCSTGIVPVISPRPAHCNRKWKSGEQLMRRWNWFWNSSSISQMYWYLHHRKVGGSWNAHDNRYISSWVDLSFCIWTLLLDHFWKRKHNSGTKLKV